MTTQSPMLHMKLTPHSAWHEIRLSGWNWRTFGAALGLSGGLIAPVFGSLLTAISWFTGSVWHGLHVQRDGTVLLFLTIPLLAFGAFCLDLIDKEGESRK